MAIPILERLGLRRRGSRGQENNHPTVEKDVAMATQTIEEAPATSAGEGRPWIEGSELRDTKAPAGPIEGKWAKRQFEAKLVNPANRRKLTVIIVGTGLAGGAAAASLGEAGYNRCV